VVVVDSFKTFLLHRLRLLNSIGLRLSSLVPSRRSQSDQFLEKKGTISVLCRCSAQMELFRTRQKPTMHYVALALSPSPTHTSYRLGCVGSQRRANQAVFHVSPPFQEEMHGVVDLSSHDDEILLFGCCPGGRRRNDASKVIYRAAPSFLTLLCCWFEFGKDVYCLITNLTRTFAYIFVTIILL
jgi:hypothetical protein